MRRRRGVFDGRREERTRSGLLERGRSGGTRAAGALRRGGARTQRTGTRVGKRIGPIFTVVLSLPLIAAAAAIALASRIGAWIARQLDALSEIVRPEYAVAAVAAASCALLGLSQFVHFTALEVDSPGYSGEIGRVAPAPLAAPEDAGSAHAYILIPVAIVALLLIAATLAGRWRLGRLVALCGVIGIVVTLAIDLPKGLDAGRAGLAYASSTARLGEGFYAQLAASASLALSGALLGVFVHRAHPAPRAGARRFARRGRQRRVQDVPPPSSGRLGAMRRWGIGA